MPNKFVFELTSEETALVFAALSNAEERAHGLIRFGVTEAIGLSAQLFVLTAKLKLQKYDQEHGLANENSDSH